MGLTYSDLSNSALTVITKFIIVEESTSLFFSYLSNDETQEKRRTRIMIRLVCLGIVLELGKIAFANPFTTDKTTVLVNGKVIYDET